MPQLYCFVCSSPCCCVWQVAVEGGIQHFRQVEVGLVEVDQVGDRDVALVTDPEPAEAKVPRRFDGAREVFAAAGNRRARAQAGEEIIGPDGRERALPELQRTGLASEAGDVTWTPPEPGLWQVKVSAKGEERLEPRLMFAVWPDARESDTRRLDPAELAAWFGGESHARVASDARATGGHELPLWSLLLILGLAAFFAEGVLIA